ncbi:MAG: iron ABC transporter permease [Thermoleophilaceae bacterium]|nr:iron ABC transporter permease [Thermoleophilaceae bacterium]
MRRYARAVGRQLPAALAVGLTLIPIAYLVIRAFGASSDSWGRLLDWNTAQLLVNSLGLAFAVTLACMVIALPYAWLVTQSDLPGRRIFATLGPLPLVVPSYVGALMFVAAFGPRGLTQQALEHPLGIEALPPIYGFFGAFVTLTAFTYPYVLLTLTAAFRRLDHTQIEAARGLGASPLKAFRKAGLPQLRPALFSGGLLCALYVLSDFGVVSIMRFDTFTRAIYVSYRSFFDREGAALLSLVLVLVTVLVVLAYFKLRGDSRRQTVTAAGAQRPRTTQLGRWRYLGLAFCGGVLLIALVTPAVVLGYWLVVGGNNQAMASSLLDAVIGSVSASGLAAILATALAVPIAYTAARSSGLLSRALEVVTTAGFALPGIVVALGLVFFATRFALVLYGTLLLLVLAYVIRFLPQVIGSSRSAFVRADPQLEEAARGLGLSPRRAFFKVTLPLAAPGVLVGTMLVFLTAMKELPATLILKPIGFETLATRVWASAQSASYSDAAIPALILIAISAIPLFISGSDHVDPGSH